MISICCKDDSGGGIVLHGKGRGNVALHWRLEKFKRGALGRSFDTRFQEWMRFTIHYQLQRV